MTCAVVRIRVFIVYDDAYPDVESMEIANFIEHVEKIKILTPRDIIKQIRWDETSNKGSVLDVIKMVTGNANEREIFSRLRKTFPDVVRKCDNLKFPGKGQRDTPVADAVTLVEISYICPGKVAAQSRRLGAEVLCRALAGDLSLIDDIVHKHGEIDLDTQEKLLSGTSSTPEQANAFPESFKRISESNVIFKQPMLYLGRYLEDDNAMSLKIGLSEDILERIKKEDQKNRMFWTYLITMPNKTVLMAYENAIKEFANKHNLLSKKTEYMSSLKFGRLLGVEQCTWLPEDAAHAFVKHMLSDTLHEGHQIYRVSHSELPNIITRSQCQNEDGIMIAQPVQPARDYARIPEDIKWSEYEKTFNELPFGKEYGEDFARILGLRLKNAKKGSSQELELEKEKEITERERVIEREISEREKEREITEREKEMTARKKIDLITTLVTAGKTLNEINQIMSLIDTNTHSKPSMTQSQTDNQTQTQTNNQTQTQTLTQTQIKPSIYATKENMDDHYSEFLHEVCVRNDDAMIKTIDLAYQFRAWCDKKKITLWNKDPRQHIAGLISAFQTDTWKVIRKRIHDKPFFIGIAYR